MANVLKGTKLAEAVSKTIGQINEHVGSNGQGVHLPATIERDGFLSSTDKKHLDWKGRYAKTVDNGTDILSLDMGVYVGRSLVNAPSSVDGSLVLVKITGAGGGQFKQIEFTWLSANKTYIRTIYSTIDTGWKEGGWQNIILNAGWSGTARARVVNTGVLNLVEVNLDISKLGTVTGEFGTLPEGCLNTSGKQMIFQVAGFRGNSLYTPLACRVDTAHKLTLFSQGNTEAYAKATGNFMFFN